MIFLRIFEYLSDNLLKPLLNLSKNLSKGDFFFSVPWLFFKIIAQSAGVSVKATIPDRIIDVAMVIEN